MTIFKGVKAILLTGVCLCTIAQAGLQSVPNIEQLVAQADVIAIVETQSVQDAQTNAPALSLTTRRVVKGAIPAGAPVPIARNASMVQLMTSKTAELGIVFLKRVEQNQFEPVVFAQTQRIAVEDFQIPAAANVSPSYGYSAEQPVLDRVLAEIANATESNPTDVRLGFVHHGALERFSSPIVRTLYERLASAPQPERKGLGLAGLIRLGDTRALQQVEVERQQLRRTSGFSIITFSIAAYYRTDDSAGIATLGRIAMGSSDDRPLALAAAQALVAIHSAECLPALSALLDSPDREMQSLGVGGLALFANQGRGNVRPGAQLQPHITGREDAPFRTKETLEHFAMGPEAFNKDPDRYVAFWKRWLAENRSRIGK